MLTGHHFRTVEALIGLAMAGAAIRLLPFAWIASVTGEIVAGDGDDASTPPTRDPVAAAVGHAIRRGATRLPWHSSCLVRALAARLMLLRRGVPTRLVLGVATENGAVLAHAWLIAGGGTVCGGRQSPAYVPIAAFRAPHL